MSARRESYQSRVDSLAHAIETRIAVTTSAEWPKRIGRETGIVYRFRMHTQKVHRGPVAHHTFEVVALNKSDAWAIACPFIQAASCRVGVVAVRMLADNGVGKMLVPK